MTAGPPEIDALREALSHSPDNVPLRRHLAETLARLGRPGEAEREYREALRRAPGDAGLELGLAHAFHAQDKLSEALVIVESLIKGRAPAPAVYRLYVRLMVRTGDVERAVRVYRGAVADDPEVADEALAAELGIDADEEAFVVDGRIREREDDGPGERPPELERPGISFADVGGMESVKEEVRLKIIHPLTHPEIYAAYGKTIGGGILLYGPPGCGKTHIARATAGEVDASFITVGIHDVLEMWIGSSERNLHAIFEGARAHTPCVLFFDEVDALGARRSDMRQSASKQVINQFLAELDGVRSSNEGVLIVAATNAPWHLDSAFRRPGRFDRVVFVPPPDEIARAEILALLLAGKPTDGVDCTKLARATAGFSGADLKGVVDRAVEAKLSEALKAGVPQPLRTKDLHRQVKGHKPTTQEWFSTARNYALYANQGGIYDDILAYLDR